MSRKSAILVTGGAGYIGSHTAKLLAARGYRPVVYDDLSSGHRDAARWGDFVRGDIRDASTLSAALEDHGVVAVIHLAGLIEVGRSVERPDLFYDVNVNGTMVLLDAMRRAGVPRLVFSSSAAVYGQDATKPVGALIDEDDPKAPASPYGETKLVGERMIEAYCGAFGMSAIALRYFNAAGCDPTGQIGEARLHETHLIPLAIDAATGKRPNIQLFGTDYPTADGTCLRDYVHVDDLSRAHIAAFPKLDKPGTALFYNLGTGTPTSNRQVIQAVEKAVGKKITVIESPRRPGDPAALYADSSKAQTELGWKIKFPDIDSIVATAWKWHKSNPNGYGDRPKKS